MYYYFHYNIIYIKYKIVKSVNLPRLPFTTAGCKERTIKLTNNDR